MTELFSTLVAAGFYVVLGVFALFVSEGVCIIGGQLEERKRKAKLARIRRP